MERKGLRIIIIIYMECFWNHGKIEESFITRLTEGHVRTRIYLKKKSCSDIR